MYKQKKKSFHSKNNNNQQFSKFTRSVFFRFLKNKKKNNFNNNNNKSKDNYHVIKQKNDSNNKNMISFESCIKVKEFLKKLEQNQIKIDEKNKIIHHQKQNPDDMYKHNMNNCIKLLATSAIKNLETKDSMNKSNCKHNIKYDKVNEKIELEKLNIKVENEEYDSKNLVLTETSAKLTEVPCYKNNKDESINEIKAYKTKNSISNNLKVNSKQDSLTDVSSESDLISLVILNEPITNLNLYNKYVSFNPSKHSHNQNNIKQAYAYSCLNAGSKLLELFNNFRKKL